MQDIAADRARIVAPPPVIYLGILGLGLLLEWLWPTRLLSWSLAVGVGLAILVCGVIGLAAAIRTTWRAQTPIDPYKATTVLVTDGLFRFSRNPIYDSRDASPRQGAAAARLAASALGITLVEREVRNVEDITRGLKGLDEGDALLGIPGGVTSGHYEAMIRAANSKRLPSIFHTRTRSTRDALLTYGASDVDVARQAARVLDKILKGANAGDLPVERPTKLTLVINLKTAEALGITVPQTLLLRADQVLR